VAVKSLRWFVQDFAGLDACQSLALGSRQARNPLLPGAGALSRESRATGLFFSASLFYL
jgi:hypothetical protein